MSYMRFVNLVDPLDSKWHAANLFDQPIDGVFDICQAINLVVPGPNSFVGLPHLRFVWLRPQEAIT